MYQKVINKKSNRNRYSIPCFVDGIEYPSLSSAAIDFELGYPWLFLKIKKSKGAPIKISNHEIVFKSWLEEHPEYKMKQGACNERFE